MVILPKSGDREHDSFLKNFLPVQIALRAFLFSVMRNHSEADDLFQEVAMILWNKFDAYDPSRSFTAWAIGIAKFEVLKRKQTFARSRLVFSDEAVAALALAANEDAEAADERQGHLAECLKKLPSRERLLVDMRFEQKKLLSEIATATEKSTAAVEMMMVRVRRWLRDCVEKSLAQEKGAGI